MELELTWTELKTFVDNRYLYLQYIEKSDQYFIFAQDSNILYKHTMYKNPTITTDIDDFEDNYKASANKKLQPTDSDNALLTRVKTTLSGWKYQLHSFDFTTSSLASLYSKDKANNNLGFCTYKIYDTNGTEITASENQGNAVKTVVTWEPTHDYEIIGGKMFQSAAPASDVRVWVVAVPDITEQYGGSISFAAGGFNIKYCGTGIALDTDGRSSKRLNYSSQNHTNKFEITLKHNAGVQHSLMFAFEIYRP